MLQRKIQRAISGSSTKPTTGLAKFKKAVTAGSRSMHMQALACYSSAYDFFSLLFLLPVFLSSSTFRQFFVLCSPHFSFPPSHLHSLHVVSTVRHIGKMGAAASLNSYAKQPLRPAGQPPVSKRHAGASAGTGEGGDADFDGGLVRYDVDHFFYSPYNSLR